MNCACCISRMNVMSYSVVMFFVLKVVIISCCLHHILLFYILSAFGLFDVRVFIFFFCSQNTAYEMRISDWSSDVCASDLSDAVKADMSEHIENFRSRIAGNQELPLSGDIRAALQSVAPALTGYIESAQNIVGLALTDRAAAEAALPAFSESFN